MQFFPDDGCAIVCFVSKIKLPSGHMVHLFHVNGRASRKNCKNLLQKVAHIYYEKVHIYLKKLNIH